MATFLLIHGAWCGAWCWTDLVAALAARGHGAVTLDLPGAASRAAVPSSFVRRPFDPVAYAAEASPNAGVTQTQRTEATVQALRHAGALGRPVILLGHSWGGLTASHVAEAAPAQLAAVIYLGAYMLAAGDSAAAMLKRPEFEAQTLGALFRGHPAKTGAMRLDPRSDDPAYIDALHRCLGEDVPRQRFAALMGLMHPDEPANTGLEPCPVTAARFGTVPRHYIRLDADQTLPPAAQDTLIQRTDASVNSTTRVHPLAGGHSPHLAKPDALADLLHSITQSVRPPAP